MKKIADVNEIVFIEWVILNGILVLISLFLVGKWYRERKRLQHSESLLSNS